MAIYDPAKNLWTDAKPKGPSPKGYDACGCHDTKRGRIYRNDGDGSKGEGLMAYDIGDNTWSHLKPTGTAPEPANTNAAFYESKLASARFWMERLMPDTASLLERVKMGADGLMTLDAANF